MFLGYSQNHTRGTYCMLNLRKKCIVLSREILCLDKTYVRYVSIQEHTKAGSYIIQDVDESDKWYHIKTYPFKTENIKINQNVKTKQDYRCKEY